jgi:hypothetical protein
MIPPQESKVMNSQEIWSPSKNTKIPEDMERAEYWADLLCKVADKHDVYDFARSNLDRNNQNAIREKKARKILKEAVKRYEEIYRH